MDPTTVIAILALNLLCAGGLFAAIGRRLPPRQGLGLFAVGTALLGVAYGLRLLQGLPSAHAGTLLPDTMMVAAVLLFVAGLRELVGRERGNVRQFAALAAGFVVIQAAALAVSGSLGRHVWLNLALGAGYSMLAAEALHEARHGPDALRRPLWLIAGLMGGLATLTLARSLWVAVAGTGQLYTGWPAQLYFGYASLATLLLLPCLYWMVFLRLQQQFTATALRDPLTATLNRDGLAEAMARHWGTRPLRPLTLMQIDIDHFGLVNERHGEAVGDQLLKAVAKTLTNGVRAGDLLARIGGEEFLVVCVDMHPMAARGMAERLREAVAQLALPVATSASNLSVTVSLGVSRPCDAAHKVKIAWQECDQAMLAAKESGRDRVRMASTLEEVQLERAPEPQSGAQARRGMQGSTPAHAVAAPVDHALEDENVDTTPEGLLHSVERTVPEPQQRAAD